VTRTVLPFQDEAAWRTAARRAVGHLQSGGLLAHPTETVYGLGCALRDDALDRLARLKRRDNGPFLVLLGYARPPAGVEWTTAASRLAAAFWPGPLTLVVRTRAGAFPARVLGADGTLAVRATSHPGVALLLRELGAPMTSTSANERGELPASDRERALDVLDGLDPDGAVWLLDGGSLDPSPPSTLVECTDGPPRVRRAGAVDIARLREVIDDIRTS
jgi:L-threonylcarbamoyladenylate synthase